MFTRNSIVLSNSIKTPLTAISKAIGSNGILKYSYNFDEIIRQIFSHQEQGFAYDPNDLSTMFQDAAGTVPVTAAGQPVGLMLDKSRGLVLGSELVVNGDFSNGTAGWTANGSEISIVDGKLQVTSLSSYGGYAYQAIQTTVGKWHTLSVDISTVNGSLAAISVGTTFDGIDVASILDISDGAFTLKFLAKTATSYLLLQPWTNAAGRTCQFDNVSVKELTGNHAYQTTSSMRPILRQNATTGAYYLAFDGSDDFLVTKSIDFTATDKVSLFAGVRKLSDAGRGMIAELSASVGSYNGTFSIEGTDGGARKYFQQSKGSLLSIAGTSDVIFSAPTNAVLTSKLNINTDTNELIVNGLYRYTSTQDQGTGNYGNYPLYIGRRGGTTFPFNGHIYSLIGIGRLTTDNETMALEKLIAKRVGVTLSV